MKRWMTWLLLLTLMLLALCGGCGNSTKTGEAEYNLYFLVNDGGGSGPALGTEPYTGLGEPDPENLVRALLAGPAGEGLRSPFPRGVTFQGWNWDPEEPGNLQITLSDQYSGLTDIALTLADYSIVLTLSQLEGVESVEILSQGYATGYRSHQILTAEEALLVEEGLSGG